MPISTSFLACESIWQQTKARREEVSTWGEALKHFTHSQHVFLARGGELLYLQLCNALRQPPDNICSLRSDLGIALDATETNPKSLYDALTNACSEIKEQCPHALDKLACLIDEIDGATAQATDGADGLNDRFTRCGWCPEDSWREGYLFAVEFLRVCQANLDPIKRVEMLTLCCAFQVLRSLCAQSARVAPWPEERLDNGNGLRFVWAISSPSGGNRIIKQISQRNLLALRELIHSAIRIPEIQENIEREPEKVYKEADTRYGDKLFLSLSKKLGFVVPQRGPGARFVFSDQILRYLVLALIRPGERCTLDKFKDRLFAHYGLAIDGEYIQRACIWSGYPPLSSIATSSDDWFVQMLRAAGFLIHLSDACSLVQNPFGEADA